eukprot:92702-Alexandrium_andersonii.AAC.1
MGLSASTRRHAIWRSATLCDLTSRCVSTCRWGIPRNRGPLLHELQARHWDTESGKQTCG